MKRQADLIDRFTDLVLGADEPRKLAERTIEVVMALVNGRSGAVFTTDAGARVTLFASRGIDQHVLEIVQEAWQTQRPTFEAGDTFYVAERDTDRRLRRLDSPGGPAGFVIVPVLAEDEVAALLYVDSLDPHFCAPHDLERLGKFSRIVAKAVGDSASASSDGPDWQSYLERTPVEDMEREKLLLLLNRNEWNIARVSRLMGVTRRTVYLRLQRYNIPRERIRKSTPRQA